MDDYLSKPVTLEGLARVLNRRKEESVQEPCLPEEPLQKAGADRVRSRLQKMTEMVGSSAAVQIVELFLGQTLSTLGKMEELRGEGDGAAVAKEAHSLRGAYAQFGADRMMELCDALEKAGTKGDLERVPEFLEQLDAEFRSVREVLLEWRDARRRPPSSG